MSRTVTRLFDTHLEATKAVEALERQGVDSSKISVIANNTDDWHGKGGHGVDNRMGDANHDGENDVADGAGKGAATGGLVGGGAGLLAGLGMLAIPGLGPVVAAGWLASAAVGAVVGAVAGGATGGLLGALKEAGHTNEEAHVYAEGVRRGGTLVSVKVDDDDASRIEAMLADNRGVDAMTRGAAYRASGWSTFEPDAQPYSTEDVARERQAYREERSFVASDRLDASDDTPGDTPRSPGANPTSRPF